MPALNPRTIIYALLLIGLALVPLLSEWAGNRFYLSLFNRIVILAIAAVSLNLIMGYGGMISLGHAVYIGIGGYVVGIMTHHGLDNGWIHLVLAIGISALYALIIGAISLRTRGIYFIMITMAFAQIVYFLGVGAYEYGGDDGLSIYSNSDLGGWLKLSNKKTLYWLCYALLLLSIYLVHRVANSRFGMVVQGSMSNDRRMNAIGFPTYRYRLACFVISGALCGLSGALMANYSEFISPVMMDWTRSADLIVMVVLGGLGSLFGPLVGTVLFVLLEHELSALTEVWKLIFGPMLVLLVLFARGGVDGLLRGRRRG